VSGWSAGEGEILAGGLFLALGTGTVPDLPSFSLSSAGRTVVVDKLVLVLLSPFYKSLLESPLCSSLLLPGLSVEELAGDFFGVLLQLAGGKEKCLESTDKEICFQPSEAKIIDKDNGFQEEGKSQGSLDTCDDFISTEEDVLFRNEEHANLQTKSNQEDEVDTGGIQLFSPDGLLFSSEEESNEHKNQLEEDSVDDKIEREYVNFTYPSPKTKYSSKSKTKNIKKCKTSIDISKKPKHSTTKFKTPRGRTTCKNCFQEFNNRDVPMICGCGLELGSKMLKPEEEAENNHALNSYEDISSLFQPVIETKIKSETNDYSLSKEDVEKEDVKLFLFQEEGRLIEPIEPHTPKARKKNTHKKIKSKGQKNVRGSTKCSQCERIYNNKSVPQKCDCGFNLGGKYVPFSTKQIRNCIYCDFTTKYMFTLQMHINNKHLGIKYDCDSCDFQTGIKQALTTHTRALHERRLIKCKDCDFSSRYKDAIYKHAQKVHDGTRYRCDVCPHISLDKDQLRKHRKRHANKEKGFLDMKQNNQ
jgi:hypothetical protein